ncbi:MAG: IclR family transcriptional regulator [Devosia sp.]|nr:IclR family transcriptional regulator [Devosia sp.]
MARAGDRAADGHIPTVVARIQSVARAKALLDAMTTGDWILLRDLATRTGLAKTTAFNLVTALVDVGLAERDAAAGAYRLSLHHLVYGKAVERRLDIAAIARPLLVKLCATTRETVNLALPGSADAVIVESLEGSQTLRVSSYSGTRAAYHSTACGRALFAHQSRAFRDMIYSIGPLQPATERTITDPEALESVLERCRKLGWTTEYEENETGGACVAAPVFSPTGDAIAAVSIAGPAARFEPETIERLGRLLVASLAEITAELARVQG